MSILTPLIVCLILQISSHGNQQKPKHRIVESQHPGIFWVQRDPQRSSSPIPGYEQRQLSLGHTVESPIQPDLENYESWGTHSFSSISVPVSHHPHQKKKKNLPPANLPLLSLSLNSIIPHCTITPVTHCKLQSKSQQMPYGNPGR